MSAPNIPNLNTLRRGGLRGRGRLGATSGVERQSHDAVIQSTDNDAGTSRLSAVEAGYLDDPFAKLLTAGETQARLPLMNRGSYVRTQGIDIVVHAFLQSFSGRKQIISLGAGSDTRYFRLKRRNPALDLNYHEIDFAANTKVKIGRLEHASQQIEQLTGVSLNISQGAVHCPDYHIHSQDLRTLDPVNGIEKIEHVPTLLISECCLIYLSPLEAEKTLNYFTKTLSGPLAIVIYEPIRPNDAFGRTMVRNLTARGIHLQTLEKYADLQNQRQRLGDHGFTSKAADTELVWRAWIDEQEKDRVESLEWMDEVEEFVLLAKHYCISWGWRDFSDENQMSRLLEG